MIPKFLLIHDVQVKKYLGSGAYGAKYDEPQDAKMRIEPKRKKTTDAQGVEFVSNALAIAEPGIEINLGSIVTFNDREYTVKDWQSLDTDGGTHHIEMVLV